MSVYMNSVHNVSLCQIMMLGHFYMKFCLIMLIFCVDYIIICFCKYVVMFGGIKYLSTCIY